MKAITNNPFKALTFTTQTILDQLGSMVGSVARELHEQAVSQNLDITGPIYWIYEGMDGSHTKPFKLTIALPVSGETDQQGKYNCQLIPTFKYLSVMHYGAWNKMHEPYSNLVKEAMTQKLTPSNISREVYIHSDFNNPDNNITEVQLGVL